MSSTSEASDFAACYRMYKQLESESQPSETPRSQQSARAAGLRSQVQRSSRPLSTQTRPSSQQLPRNASEISAFLRSMDDLKRRLDDIHASLSTLQHTSEQIKRSVEENMAIINGNMERFEVIGRGVLNVALQPTNPPPHVHHSKAASQGPSANQPLIPGTSSGLSQSTESFAEPSYMEYSFSDLLASDN